MLLNNEGKEILKISMCMTCFLFFPVFYANHKFTLTSNHRTAISTTVECIKIPL